MLNELKELFPDDISLVIMGNICHKIASLIAYVEEDLEDGAFRNKAIDYLIKILEAEKT